MWSRVFMGRLRRRRRDAQRFTSAGDDVNENVLASLAAMMPRWLHRYSTLPLGALMTGAFVLGALVGRAAGPAATVLQPLGELFIRLLTALVLPLMVCTIVSALGAVSPRRVGRVGVAAAAYYGVMAVGGAAIGVGAAALIRPGVGLAGTAVAAPRATPGLGSMIASLVPDNVVAAAADGQFLGVVVFAVPFALALGQLRATDQAAHYDVLYEFFDAFGRATHEILKWVMLYAPVGAFALTAVTLGRSNAASLAQFARVLGTLFIAEAVAAVILMSVLAWCLRRTTSIVGVREVLMTALITGSSAATVPVELDIAQRLLRLPPRVVSLTIPLGVGVSKVGSAAYIAVVSLFAANAGGVPMTPAAMSLVWMLAAIGSVATPPAGGGALLVLGFVFAQAGLPTQMIGVIAAIPEAGRLNTPVNSLGRLTAAAIVARSNPELIERV
jgi:Na+/H+-dicarboxylate symporter